MNKNLWKLNLEIKSLKTKSFGNLTTQHGNQKLFTLKLETKSFGNFNLETKSFEIQLGNKTFLKYHLETNSF